MFLRIASVVAVFATLATAQTLSLVSGDGQLIPYGSGEASVPIVFSVMNGATPVANQTITFTNSDGSPGTSLIPSTATTNASGTVAVIFNPAYINGNIYEQFTLQAHYSGQVIQFHETSAEVPPSQLLLTAPKASLLSPLTAKAGQAGPQIKVNVDASFQGYIPNVAIHLVPIRTQTAAPPGTVLQTATCIEAGATQEGNVFTDTSGNALCTPIFTLPNGALNPTYDTPYFKISVGDSFSFGPFAYNITPAPLTISGPQGALLLSGVASTLAVTATGGVQPYTFTLTTTSGLLPGGLALQSNGEITGTSNTPGLYPFTVLLKDHTGTTLTSPTYSIAISGGAFLDTPQTIPDAVVGLPYSQSISITGGVPPYKLSLGGTLAPGLVATADPTGLSIKLSGTPTAASNASLGVKIVDAVNSNGVLPLLGFQVVPSLSVSQLNTQLATTLLPFQVQVPITGGLPPYTVTAANLPSGLSISSTGLISGTPNATPGPYTVLVSVTDSLGLTGSSTFTIDVSGGVLTLLGSTTYPVEPAGAAISQQLSITGGVPPYSFVVAANPDQNLTISPSGLLTGTISTAGNVTVVFSVTDSAATTKPFTIVIPVQPSIAPGGILNSGSFLAGGVAPGEIVSIFGSGLGPDTPLYATLSPNGLVSTIAGTVQVFFGPNAAPILYAGQTQLNVVVPFEVIPGQNVLVTVTSNGQTSVAFSAVVAQSQPGIFIVGGTNSPNQGAVLNQDLSLNGPSNPAKSGSVIVVYATGGGVLSAPVADGELPTGLITIANTVLTVGGQPATISFAGLAPGYAGLIQVNATLPAGIATGPAVPIILAIGGASSIQQSATVAIQ